MKLIAKKDVVDVLRSWSSSYSILSPTLKEQGDCVFDTFNPDTFTLEYRKPSMPFKSSFLPQSEVIFTVDKGNFTPVLHSEKVLLFGIRACDMMGILQSRSFYGRNQEDDYFRAHSENTIIVVHACSWPQNETCFCTTTHSGPYAKQGFDIQLFDIGNDFLVEAGSEIGHTLISLKPFVDLMPDDAEERINRVKHMAYNSIPLVPEVPEAMDLMNSAWSNEGVWEELGRKCIACGGCVYVCPSCTCFNVTDRVASLETGERIRTWDTCLYGGFTREASGLNPRSTQALRLKRRHEHKLLNFNKTDNQGALCGCVGCGRCSDFCPVHIGTLEVAKAIVEHIY